jgi:hypothetical protein
LEIEDDVPELFPIIVPALTQAAGALRLPAVIANPFATRRVPLHAEGFPLVLLYSARAGSSALIKWFFFQTGHIAKAEDIEPGVHRFHRSFQAGQRFYGWRAFGLLLSHKKPVFKLVRNPYDRAVSSFLSTVLHTRGNQANAWGLRIVAAARRHAGKPSSGEPALSFRDFLRFLQWNGTANGAVNGHVARQHLAGEERYVDRLIRIERFEEDIRGIEAEYGLRPSPLDWIGELHNEWPDNSAEEAPSDALTASDIRRGRFPAYRFFYDEETRGLVRECFAADFAAYGYAP